MSSAAGMIVNRAFAGTLSFPLGDLRLHQAPHASDMTFSTLLHSMPLSHSYNLPVPYPPCMLRPFGRIERILTYFYLWPHASPLLLFAFLCVFGTFRIPALRMISGCFDEFAVLCRFMLLLSECALYSNVVPDVFSLTNRMFLVCIRLEIIPYVYGM